MSTRHIVAKDLRLLTRDRRALTTLLLMPLIFIAILGFSTGKIFGQPDRDALLYIGIVDLDQSDLAGELIAALHRRPEMRLDVLRDTATADEKIKDGEPGVAVLVLSGGTGSISTPFGTVVLDPATLLRDQG